MPEPLNIARYRKSDRDETFSFIRSVYPPERSARLIQQWDWKYDSNPFNCESDPYVLLMRDGDKIVGMMGAIPLRACLAGKEHLIRSGCDWIIHTDYRGRGLMRKMDEQYLEDHSIGFGWANILSNRIYLSATNAASIRLVPQVKPLFRRLGFLSREPDRFQQKDGIRIVPIERFDARFDALSDNALTQYPVMLVRNERYLNWRFDSRPDAKYTRLCAIRGDELLGYLVFRVVEKTGSLRGYLVDWLVRDSSSPALLILIRRAIAQMQQQGAAFISVRTVTPAFRRMFYRLGFLPWYWGAREYLIARIKLLDPELQVFRDPRAWYSTMADGDLEMAY